MLPSETFDAILNLVAESTGNSREKLTPTSRLGLDLGVDGDDAAELMEAFAHKFQIDMTGYNFDSHFGPEAAFNPSLYLYWRLFAPHKLEFVEITVEDLMRAALTRKWRV